jgi:streptomycin 6-kinase
VNAQVEIICATLQRMWMPAPHDARLPSGADKGRWLADFIAGSWEELGRPCSVQAYDRALSFAERRISAFDPDVAVLAHGDAHAWNTLEDPRGPDAPGFTLVDPDGLVAEREYDLAISMREFNDELLVGDTLRLGEERCGLLARLTGADASAIWQWGLIERVANGLLWMQQAGERWARDNLRIADLWAVRD